MTINGRQLTQREKDMITVKTTLMEEEMRKHRYDSTYVHKPKLSVLEFLLDNPRVAIIAAGPVVMLITSAVVDLLS